MMTPIKKEIKKIHLRKEERDFYKTLIKGKYNFSEFFRLEIEKFLKLDMEVFSLPAPPLEGGEKNRLITIEISPKISKAIKSGKIPTPIGRSIRKIMNYQTKNDATTRY